MYFMDGRQLSRHPDWRHWGAFPMRRLRVIPLLLGCLVLAAPATARTPVANPADACTIAPRAPDDLAGLGARATPVTGEQIEPYFIEEAALPVGESVDAETVAELTDLLTERAACVRDLDFARVYALYTDRYLVDFFSAEGLPDVAALLATPNPRPDYRFGSIARPTLLPDGRVSAFVAFVGADIEDDHPRPGVTYLMIFQRVDGAWRIDRQFERYLPTATQGVLPIAALLDDEATPAA